MTDIRDLHKGWIEDPAYRADYDALEGEFALVAALIRARAEAGLTQEQLAERMSTKQGGVPGWEGGKVSPQPAPSRGWRRRSAAREISGSFEFRVGKARPSHWSCWPKTAWWTAAHAARCAWWPTMFGAISL